MLAVMAAAAGLAARAAVPARRRRRPARPPHRSPPDRPAPVAPRGDPMTLLTTETLDPVGVMVADVDLADSTTPGGRPAGCSPSTGSSWSARPGPRRRRLSWRCCGASGTLTFTAGETPLEGLPDLNVISNVGRDAPPRSFPRRHQLRRDAAGLHGAARGTVPGAGRRHAVQRPVPRLRHPARGPAERSTGAHHPRRDRRRPRRRRRGVAEHPVFRPHPTTGRPRSTSRRRRGARRSVGWTRSSEEVVAHLFEHSTRRRQRPATTWAPGDVVMWDNACVCTAPTTPASSATG